MSIYHKMYYSKIKKNIQNLNVKKAGLDGYALDYLN